MNKRFSLAIATLYSIIENTSNKSMSFMLLVQILLLQSITTSVFGQINFHDMALDSQDSLRKSYIRNFSLGSGGRNKIWDFSNKLSSKHSQKIMFAKDSTNVISITDGEKSGYYQFYSDTLVLIASESAKETMSFPKEYVCIKNILTYNDSISTRFRCDGIYCGNHPFRRVGTSTLKVDAEGSIVLAAGDTIPNVKRVHTIDSYSICMDLDSAALDTAKLTQVVDERYAWYLNDSHYPIIENATSTTYLNMNAVLTTRYACCNLPDDKAALYVTEDDNDESDFEDSTYDEEATDSTIIHYRVETVGGIVHITYDLDNDAAISLVIANHMGMTYRHSEWVQNAGEGYSAQIDCNGLRSGIYILYINVNGKVYSEKVTI